MIALSGELCLGEEVEQGVGARVIGQAQVLGLVGVGVSCRRGKAAICNNSSLASFNIESRYRRC